MSKKLRQAVAIIALIFMALFAVSLVLCLIDYKMLNGAVGFLALFTGFIGISLYLVIYFNDKAAKRNEEAAKRHDLTDAEPPKPEDETQAKETADDEDGQTAESADNESDANDA